MAVPLAACMTLVASLYNLPPRVLPAIHVVEGGGTATVHTNADGSQDLGYMQVNTRWLPVLARYSGLPEAAVRENMLSRPCFNIAAAGYVLRTYMNETHDDFMLAIGNYHSHTQDLNVRYQGMVRHAAEILFSPSRR